MIDSPEDFLSIGMGFIKKSDEPNTTIVKTIDKKTEICQDFTNKIKANIEQLDPSIQNRKEMFIVKKEILDEKVENDPDVERDEEISREMYMNGGYGKKPRRSLEDFIINAVATQDLVVSEVNMMKSLAYLIKISRDCINKISGINDFLDEKEFAMRTTFANLIKGDTKITTTYSYLDCGQHVNLLESFKNIITVCSKIDRTADSTWILNINELGCVNNWVDKQIPLWKTNLESESNDVYGLLPRAIDKIKSNNGGLVEYGLFGLKKIGEKSRISEVLIDFDTINTTLKLISDIADFFTSSDSIDAIANLKNNILEKEREPEVSSSVKFNNSISFIYEFAKVVFNTISVVAEDIQKIIYVIEPESRVNTLDCL